MEKNEKQALFETTPVPKAVMSLALPTIAACLVMVIYNLADTFFVGKLNNPTETSAVTLAAPVLLAFNAVNNLFGTGCSSVMSRALGAKDYRTVKKASSFGIYGSILAGLIFSLVCTAFRPFLLNLLGADASNSAETSAYLFWTVTCGAVPSILNVVMANVVRAEGSAVHASIGTMSGCLLNIVLDPIFIMDWGLGMGAAGAGCATFISNMAACIYLMAFAIIRHGRTFVCLNPKMAVPTVGLIKSVFAVGIPASVQNLLNVTGMTILNNLMSGYGSEAVSAIGITHKVCMVPLYVAMGVGQGIMPLVGYNYASGNRKRMKDTIRFTAVISIGFVIFAAAGYWAGAEAIVKLFMKNGLIVEYGTAFLRGGAAAIPFLFTDFLAVGIFQACGMGGRSFVFAILRKVVLEIPALIILNRIFPMYGLAWAQFVAELVLAVAAVIILRKIVNEKPSNLQVDK